MTIGQRRSTWRMWENSNGTRSESETKNQNGFMICILSLKTLICSRTCAISLQEYSNRSNDQVRLLPLSSGQNIVFQNLSCRLTWSFLIGNGVVEVCYIYPLVVLWSMKNWIKKCCIQLLLAFLMLLMFFRRTSWLLCNSQFFVLTVCITTPCQNSQKLNFKKEMSSKSDHH